MAVVPRALKILFVMGHAGFSRNFEWVLRQLAERGHQLEIVTERLPRREAPPVILQDLDRAFENVTLCDPPPRPRDGWDTAARGVRLTLDYLRYLTPAYRRAPRLRRRAEERLPVWPRRVLAMPLVRTGAGQALCRSVLRAVERSMPPHPAIRAFLQERQPDVLLITPLVELASAQTDWVRCARELGIPTAHCVASWDNLTNKGVLHELPDLVAVWNESQKQEAVELHGVPPGRVLVTGATAFDHWFEWPADRSRAEFCQTVGLRSDRPYVIYLCSSSFIAEEESRFVVNWVRAVRADDALRDVGILIRPHPQKPDEWRNVDLSAFEQVAVWPPAGANPLDRGTRADYHDSMYYSAAVVGINTSAMIESAIMGRSVFTILAPEFGETQEGTLHFHHLVKVNGGMLHVAGSHEQHIHQLRQEMAHPAGAARSRRFVEAFVRPYGVDQPATPRLVAAIERLATRAPLPARPNPPWARVVRSILTPYVRHLERGLAAERRLKERERRSMASHHGWAGPAGVSTSLPPSPKPS